MYDYGKAKFGEKTGHFTQLVWQNTTKVGCGAVECNNDAKNGAKGWFVVCEYDPAGNVIGEFEANVRKAGDGGGNGDLGLGEDDENAGVRVSGSGRLLVALVAVSLVVGMFSW